MTALRLSSLLSMFGPPNDAISSQTSINNRAVLPVHVKQKQALIVNFDAGEDELY